MKSRRKLRQSPALKLTRKQVLIYAAVGTALAVVVGIVLFFYLNLGSSHDSDAAPPDFYSASNGFWTDGPTWFGGVAPPTTGINSDIEIFKFVTRAGDLNYKSGSNKTLIITDTLLIVGDLIMENRTHITINDGGVLIVTGNFTAQNQIVVGNGGIIAIGGNMSFPTNNQDDYNGSQGELFVVGTVSGNADASSSAKSGTILQQQYKRINDILQNGHGTLPITLLYFKAKVLKNKVEINWKTAEEKNNDFFSIERSADGKNFQVIQTIKGAGDSQTALTYTLVDETPLAGTSFYRLKQTDYDGKYEYFDIVPVYIEHAKFSAAPSLEITHVGPNPFQHTFTVAFDVPEGGEVELRLMDLRGTKLASKKMQAYTGSNRFEFQEEQSLKPGTYLMTLVHAKYQSKPLKIIRY